MKKQLVTAALSLAFASGAAAGESHAYGGIAADAITTGIALSVPGIVETNPLGWATVPIRLAIMEHAKSLPREQGQPIMDALAAGGWGAAVSNLLVLAGTGAAAPVVGLAVGYAVWKQGEQEREFWQICAMHRAMDANVKCQFKPWRGDVQVAQHTPQGGGSAAPAPMQVARLNTAPIR